VQADEFAAKLFQVAVACPPAVTAFDGKHGRPAGLLLTARDGADLCPTDWSQGSALRHAASDHVHVVCERRAILRLRGAGARDAERLALDGRAVIGLLVVVFL
jgi:hypothetical protein